MQVYLRMRTGLSIYDLFEIDLIVKLTACSPHERESFLQIPPMV